MFLYPRHVVPPLAAPHLPFLLTEGPGGGGGLGGVGGLEGAGGLEDVGGFEGAGGLDGVGGLEGAGDPGSVCVVGTGAVATVVVPLELPQVPKAL